jgi:hypothetical protein
MGLYLIWEMWISPTKVQSEIALLVKNYRLKVSITLRFTPHGALAVGETDCYVQPLICSFFFLEMGRNPQ